MIQRIFAQGVLLVDEEMDYIDGGWLDLADGGGACDGPDQQDETIDLARRGLGIDENAY